MILMYNILCITNAYGICNSYVQLKMQTTVMSKVTTVKTRTYVKYIFQE